MKLRIFFSSMSYVHEITQINKTFKEVAPLLVNFDKHLQENDIHRLKKNLICNMCLWLC